MATFLDSTRAPVRTPIPLVHRPAPPVDDPRSADELLGEIAREIDRQSATVSPEVAPAAFRGRIVHALTSVWRGIEADAQRMREAMQASGA